MRRRLVALALVLAATLVRVDGPATGSAPPVSAVAAIGVTVSDADRSAAFYTRVLGFEKVMDVEVTGDDYERLQGVFALRLRVVRMRLGDETLDLMEYLAPRGRPVPPDSRSHDRWFQHVAIVVADMDRAFVVYPDGSAQPLSVSAWKQTVTMIPPGSTIIVPRDPKPFDFLESAETISTILANIALTGFYLDDLGDED